MNSNHQCEPSFHDLERTMSDPYGCDRQSTKTTSTSASSHKTQSVLIQDVMKFMAKACSLRNLALRKLVIYAELIFMPQICSCTTSSDEDTMLLRFQIT